MTELVDEPQLARMTATIVSTYLTHNEVAVADVPRLVTLVGARIASLSSEVTEAPDTRPTPAVPIRRSIHAGYIVCLEDGRKLKLLKRYLATKYDMTPDKYRERWNLPASYRWLPRTTPKRAPRWRTESDSDDRSSRNAGGEHTLAVA